MIITIKGVDFIFDDEDTHLLKEYKWYIDSKGYLCRSINPTNDKILFHRQIMSVEDRDIFVDHIDTNPRNNRKSNLRITDISGNSKNRNRNKNKMSSKYKGVYQKYPNRFQVVIQSDGEQMPLGTFDNEDVAGYVYNINALKYHGEFALLNNTPTFTNEEIKYHRCEKRESSSKYKGVNFNKKHGKYQGNFSYKGKRYYTKFYESPQQAYVELISKKKEMGIIG